MKTTKSTFGYKYIKAKLETLNKYEVKPDHLMYGKQHNGETK